jgi:predicted PurR-regulated permease PerM
MRGYIDFVLRCLTFLALAGLALFIWRVRDAFLLAFISIIVATLLLAAASPLRTWIGLGRGWSLAAVCAAIAAALGLLVWLIGAQVQNQLMDLTQRLPSAVQNLEQRFGISIPLEELRDQPNQEMDSRRTTSGGSGGFSILDDLLDQVISWSTSIISILAGFILVVIGGVFFAAKPDLYRTGLIQLIPPRQHERARATLVACDQALRLWLLAQLLSMAIVGVLAGLGTWLIGLPAPLALGLFAGLTEFVPIVGPIAGAIPALLLALTQGMGAFWWTLALFVAVQQLESNVILPLIEKEMVKIPPALFLYAVVAFGLLFGFLGLLVAAPLTVVVYVAIKKLYVRQTLGEATDIPGES